MHPSGPTIRRRPGAMMGGGAQEPDTPKSAGGLRTDKVLQRMDVFTKVHDDFQVHTSSGTMVSAISWLLVLALVISEARSAFSPQTKEHLTVDTRLKEKLNITVNLTFHALTCAEVHVDAMDVAGDNQMHIEHSMLKQRLSESGERIGDPFTEDPTDFDAKRGTSSDYCGSCYGGETDEVKCCNTCEELMSAYNTKGWQTKTIRRTAEQCQRGFQGPSSMKKGEGCNLSGFMEVNKVAGNFHIAFGESIVKDGRHIHQFIPSEAPGFNISHSIHHISFGAEYPGRVNPLDGKVKYVSAEVGTGLYQYFIKVIPTDYRGNNGHVIRTNRISATERFKPLHRDGQARLNGETHAHNDQTSVLPGVFFIYDLSPFNVEVSTTVTPLAHFLTKLCAIAGGVFSVSRILDSVITYSGLAMGKNAGFLGGTPR